MFRGHGIIFDYSICQNHQVCLLFSRVRWQLDMSVVIRELSFFIICLIILWVSLTQMDLIVSAENGKASSTDILNSTDSITTKKLKKSETEHLLNRLVHDKWLNEVKHGIKLQNYFVNCILQTAINLYYGQKCSIFREAEAYSKITFPVTIWYKQYHIYIVAISPKMSNTCNIPNSEMWQKNKNKSILCLTEINIIIWTVACHHQLYIH